jgi:hypothetical protein
LDSSFNRPTGFWTWPASLVVQPDGKILVDGMVGPNSGLYPNVLRFNPDGTPDLGFSPLPVRQGNRYPILVDAAGKILIGNAGRLARLNQDGSADPEFDTGVLFVGGRLGYVTSAVIQPDGAYLMLGEFFVGPDFVLQRLARFRLTTEAVPPFFANAAWTSEGLFSAEVFTAPGFRYRVEGATNLTTAWPSTAWIPVTNIVGIGGLVPYSDFESRSHKSRFYRLTLP